MTALLPPGVKVHLALGYIDMRKGLDGLAMLVQGVLRQDPMVARPVGPSSPHWSPPPSSTTSSRLPTSETCSNALPLAIRWASLMICCPGTGLA